MNPYIQTYSGTMFHLLDPQEDMINMLDVAHALSLIPRFNGHTKGFMSVAQHSVTVSLLLEDEGPELALAGLLHDAPEAYIGDMVSPLKSVPSLGKPFREIEEKIARVIFAKAGIDYELIHKTKKADLIALATEARDLMGIGTNWEYWALPFPPLPEKTVPWSPEEAMMNFLDRFQLVTQALKAHRAEEEPTA